MTTTKRILFALALLGGAAAWAWLLVAIARQSGNAPVAPVSMPISMPDLDELEARMIHAAEITRRWEYLAERHRQVSAIACEQLADAAIRREVRSWNGSPGSASRQRSSLGWRSARSPSAKRGAAPSRRLRRLSTRWNANSTQRSPTMRPEGGS